MHVPAALQTAAVFSLPPEQLALAPHEVLSSGNTQVFRLPADPSQIPPQTPVPVHAVRGVVVGTHVPLLLAVEQDSHCPVQATLQQTPSAQTVLAHSAPLEHVSPVDRPTHVPLLQTGVFPLQPPQQLVLGMHDPLQSLVEPLQVT